MLVYRRRRLPRLETSRSLPSLYLARRGVITLTDIGALSHRVHLPLLDAPVPPLDPRHPWLTVPCVEPLAFLPRVDNSIPSVMYTHTRLSTFKRMRFERGAAIVGWTCLPPMGTLATRARRRATRHPHLHHRHHHTAQDGATLEATLPPLPTTLHTLRRVVHATRLPSHRHSYIHPRMTILVSPLSHLIIPHHTTMVLLLGTSKITEVPRDPYFIWTRQSFLVSCLRAPNVCINKKYLSTDLHTTKEINIALLVAARGSVKGNTHHRGQLPASPKRSFERLVVLSYVSTRNLNLASARH